MSSFSARACDGRKERTDDLDLVEDEKETSERFWRSLSVVERDDG
jgi:hypothetical protein